MKELQTQDLDRLDELMIRLEQAKKDKNEQSVIKNKIMDFMRELGLKTFRQGNITIRLTDARTTNQFDVDMLRIKYPAIWDECHSVQSRPAHLQIIRKDIKDNTVEMTDDELAELIENN